MKERILQLRERLNLSQEKFAAALGISQNHVWAVENGKRNLSERTINDICRVFNVRHEWLTTGEGEIFSSAQNDLIAMLCAEYNLTPQAVNIVRAYMAMPPEDQAAVMRYIDKIAEMNHSDQ